MIDIKFIERSHKYVSDAGELISVSKFTEQFKQKTDWNKIARGVATRLTKEGTPTTVQQVLAKWERKRNLSAEIGTLYHAIREEELLQEPNAYNKITCPIQDDGKYAIPINNLENDSIYPELMIYDMEYMICGQADKVIVQDNKIHIHDYKTDDEIKFVGWSSQWVKAKTFLPPIEHLEECNGNVYALKMSLYMFLLWKANKGRFKPGNIMIEHIKLKRDPENDNIPVLEEGKPVELSRKFIALPYLKKEVMRMLKTLK